MYDRLTASHVRFGPFDLDVRAAELRNGATRLKVPLQSIQVLKALLEQPGELVTRDELRERLWPSNTFVDFEHGLNAAVRRLRHVLGDSAGAPRSIETLPRRGYRFIGAVEATVAVTVPGEAGPEASSGQAGHGDVPAEPTGDHTPVQTSRTSTAGGPSAVEPASTPARFPRLITRLALAAAAVIMALVTAAVFGRGSPRDRRAAFVPERLTRLTYEPGYHARPSLTPDGGMVVYAADRGSNLDVWLQHTNGGPPLRLTDDPAADWQPTLSPDGTHIAFRSERDGGGLFVIPVLGGTTRRLSRFGYLPQWAPDGRHLLFVERLVRTTDAAPSLYLVPFSGGEPRRVVEQLTARAPVFCCFRGVAWHPDGRRISTLSTDFGTRWAFTTYSIDTDGVAVSDTSAAVGSDLEADPNLGEERLFSSLAWAPSGNAVYFLAYADGIRSLWRVAIDPRTLRWTAAPQRVTTGPVSLRDFAISHTGTRMVFSTFEDALRLWALPRDEASGSIVAAGSPIGIDGAWTTAPDVSRDGTRLAYVDQRGGRREIHVRDLRTGAERVLFPGDDFQRSHPRWSADGTLLSYSRRLQRHQRRGSAHLLMRYSWPEHREQPLTSSGAFIGVAQAWSPALERLLVVCYDTAATPPRARVCLLDVSAAPAAERSLRVVASDPRNHLFAQDLSPDGRWVGFNAVPQSGAASRLFVAPIDSGQPTPLGRGDSWEDKLRWAPDGRLLYFVSDATGVFNVFVRRFDTASGAFVGDAIRITDFESAARAMPAAATASSLNIAVSRTHLIIPIIERGGSVWTLDLPGEDDEGT